MQCSYNSLYHSYSLTFIDKDCRYKRIKRLFIWWVNPSVGHCLPFISQLLLLKYVTHCLTVLIFILWGSLMQFFCWEILNDASLLSCHRSICKTTAQQYIYIYIISRKIESLQPYHQHLLLTLLDNINNGLLCSSERSPALLFIAGENT